MDRIGSWTCLTLAAVLMATFGCRSRGEFRFNPRKDHYETIATEIEYPDTRIGHRRDVMETPPPRTVLSLEETPSWPITLEEAVRIALENSRVMRDIGGRVLTAPLSTASVYDPAIRETDPRGGTEAALSAFDTAFTTGLFWGKNDRVLNNILLGGGVREFRQDYANFQAELTKTAATGTQFSARNVTDYDANNAFFNLFPSARHGL